jgi:hypothetical protein
MSDTLVPDVLVEAYRQTDFRVMAGSQHFTLRIGEHSRELAALFADNRADFATFITAENPESIPTSAAENARQQAALKRDLDATGAMVWAGEGEGSDPAWPPETGWLAIGLNRDQACALGVAYRQNAIVCVGADAVPELVLLR